MNHTTFSSVRMAALTILIAVFTTATIAQTEKPQATAPQIAFTVSMLKPHTHMLEVEVRIKQRAGASAPAEERLVMPVWTPGSYLVREFERHVQDFAATDPAGNALQWEKLNKNTWRVVTKGLAEWRAISRLRKRIVGSDQ
jgi:hypothetical protein